MSKIGIYGGTFSPVHNGHLNIARAAKEQLGLKEVWWIPSGNPPHKDGTVLSRVPRYEMCNLALCGEDGQVLKDFEFYASGECYSYLLLQRLRILYPENEYFFIMGEDSLDLFDEWVHPERIAECASLAVAVRSNSSRRESIEKAAKRIRGTYSTKVFLLNTVEMPISSTELRERIANKKSVDEFVPDSVARYIKEHSLYQNARMNFPFKQTITKLKELLKPGRFRHTLGVMDTAANLAMRYSMPVEALRIAGLLHDCAKCFDNKELLAKCKKYSLPVTQAELDSPHLLHAKVGAYLAEHEYGVKDPEILSAIRVHTTGSCDMSLLEQILFVADYIEPNRDKAPRLDEIRNMAYADIDAATLMILYDTVSYVEGKNDPLDSTTLDTLEFYQRKVDGYGTGKR